MAQEERKKPKFVVLSAEEFERTGLLQVHASALGPHSRCFEDVVLELAQEAGRTVTFTPESLEIGIDRRLMGSRGSVRAVVVEDHVYYDEEILAPGSGPVLAFASQCHFANGRKKTYLENHNVQGSAVVPRGHHKYVSAISLDVKEGALTGPVKLEWRFPMSLEPYFTLELKAGDRVSLEGLMVKRPVFPVERARGGSIMLHEHSQDDREEPKLEYMDVKMTKPLELCALECWTLELHGGDSDARVRVGLHGPLIRPWMEGNSGEPEPLPFEPEPLPPVGAIALSIVHVECKAKAVLRVREIGVGLERCARCNKPFAKDDCVAFIPML